MEVKKAQLSCVGVNFSQYPKDSKPEIAFVGKSNVGKSTLINAMTNRNKLARTSSQPGKTRTINFYGINDIFYIVDVPGYGYAKAPKTEIDRWSKMTEEYMQKRKELAGIVMLIDIRHEPGENDKIMYQWLKHYGYKIVIAATKLDKIKRSQIQKQTALIKRTLCLEEGDIIIPFSGTEKTGRDELWGVIDREFLGITEEEA